MFLAPCAIGGFFVLLFAAGLDDRRLAVADRAPWSLRELAGTFYVSPRRNPDFAWAFGSRQVFLGTLAMSVVVLCASLLGGALSDRTGRRKVFVGSAALVFGLAMFVIALATSLTGFLVGMAVGGLGFGLNTAVDLALVADVLPDQANAAKDLGVMNIAGALPSSIAPAMAPIILAVSNGSYGVLYAVARACAVLGAVAILPLKRVR